MIFLTFFFLAFFEHSYFGGVYFYYNFTENKNQAKRILNFYKIHEYNKHVYINCS